MRDIELVLLLLALVTALTLVARRLTVPYPIVMVLGGLVLSQIPGLPEFQLPPDLVFFVFLPPLLFAGGYFTSFREFKANLRAIVLLAFGLVIFTAAVVAAVAYMFVPALGWAGRSPSAPLSRRPTRSRRHRSSSASACRGAS